MKDLFDQMKVTVGDLILLSKDLETNRAPQKECVVFRYVPGVTMENGFGTANYDAVIGRIHGNLSKYQGVSAEKASRLISLWQKKGAFGDQREVISSYQGRNPENNQWGGAILINKYANESTVPSSCDVMPLSGLTEENDQGVMLVTAGNHDLITPATAEDIARFAGNRDHEAFLELREAYKEFTR